MSYSEEWKCPDLSAFLFPSGYENIKITLRYGTLFFEKSHVMIQDKKNTCKYPRSVFS